MGEVAISLPKAGRSALHGRVKLTNRVTDEPCAVSLPATHCDLSRVGHIAPDTLHSLKVVRVDPRKTLAERRQNRLDAVICRRQNLTRLRPDNTIKIVDGWGNVHLPGVIANSAKFSISRSAARRRKPRFSLSRRLRAIKTLSQSIRNAPPLSSLPIVKEVHDISSGLTR